MGLSIGRTDGQTDRYTDRHGEEGEEGMKVAKRSGGKEEKGGEAGERREG
jgi:hypothetical protein